MECSGFINCLGLRLSDSDLKMVRKEKSRSYVSSEPLPERGPGKDN